MISRRDALRTIFTSSSIMGSAGFLFAGMAEGVTKAQLTLRPPGAVDEEKFKASCIKCGKCVEACPYNTLELGSATDGNGNGMPFFTPRATPCYLCSDYPCVNACPSDSLHVSQLIKENQEPTILNAQIGLAVINADTCLAYKGIQCDACYRACPKIDKAIILDYNKNTQTNKHANLIPVIIGDECTGCGICEHVCVTQKSAVHVFPRNIAMGELGSHYMQDWDKHDDKREKKIEDTIKNKKDNSSTLDYLNTDSELFD